MKLTITFKNMEHTPSLDERIREKSMRLEKYWEGQGEVKWTCSIEGGMHAAEVKWMGAKRLFQAKASSDDLYKTLDLVVNKLERQLEKSKEIQKEKIHRKAEEVTILEPEVAWSDFEAYKQDQLDREVQAQLAQKVAKEKIKVKREKKTLSSKMKHAAKAVKKVKVAKKASATKAAAPKAKAPIKTAVKGPVKAAAKKAAKKKAKKK